MAGILVMTTQAKAPIKTHLRLLALLSGLLPYSGAVLVTMTHNLLWITLAGVFVCALAAAGAYYVRTSYGSANGKSMLVVDLMLFPVYYAFAAVVVRYMFLRHG